eukprot:4170009-Alexandrium_andersonii.AAC.1
MKKDESDRPRSLLSSSELTPAQAASSARADLQRALACGCVRAHGRARDALRDNQQGLIGLILSYNRWRA